MSLVDTHVHLDDPAFDADRADVVARARAAGVTRQVVPAIDAATWPRLRDACAADDGLFAAYGLHPLLLDDHRPGHLDALRDWIDRERPVAVGECGLDYYVESLDRDTQRDYFDAQLRIAAAKYEEASIDHVEELVIVVVLVLVFLLVIFLFCFGVVFFAFPLGMGAMLFFYKCRLAFSFTFSFAVPLRHYGLANYS